MKFRYWATVALVALATACSASPPETHSPTPTPPAGVVKVKLKTNVPVSGLAPQLNGSYACQQGMETLSATPSLIKHGEEKSHFNGHVVKTMRFGESNANWVEYDTAIAKRVRALIVNNRFGATVPTYKADGAQVAHPVALPSIDEGMRKIDLCLEKPSPE